MKYKILFCSFLLTLTLTFSSCSLLGEDDDGIDEIIALSINGDEAIELDNIYCSFDDGHLYISGSSVINGNFTSVTFSIFNMTPGETGTFACEDYATSTDCLRLSYSGDTFTSGEYTGDSGFTSSLLLLERSGKVMEGAFSGVLENNTNPDETVAVGVGFIVNADD